MRARCVRLDPACRWCNLPLKPDDSRHVILSHRIQNECATQVRLTGDPYIAHCVETALIVEALHASSKALDDIDERWTAIALILIPYQAPALPLHGAPSHRDAVHNLLLPVCAKNALQTKPAQLPMVKNASRGLQPNDANLLS